MKKEVGNFRKQFEVDEISHRKEKFGSTIEYDYKKLENEQELEEPKAAENEQLNVRPSENTISFENEIPLDDSMPESKSSQEGDPKKIVEDLQKRELRLIVESERTFFPWFKISVMLASWLGIFFFALLRGGTHMPSIIGIPTCSWKYWSLFSLPWPVVFAFVVVCAFYLFKKNARKQQLQYKYVDGELQWTLGSLTIFPLICVLAGVLSALIGLGAGSLILPVLLELGSNASSAAATINLMILLSSTSQAIQFYITGKIQNDYGLSSFLFHFCFFESEKIFSIL